MGAQAAGIVTSIYSKKQQYKTQARAQQLEEAQIDLRMKQEQLAFEEQGLASVENLREVMASTQALFAAQGRTPGIGTTAAIERRSTTAFGRDERARELSKGFREHYYSSQKAVSRMTLASEKKKNKADRVSSVLNMINFNDLSEGVGGFKSPLAGIYGG